MFHFYLDLFHEIIYLCLFSEKALTAYQKIKKQDSSTQTDDKTCTNKAVQTGGTVTVADLISEEPSTDYWRILAEKRAESLNVSLEENERLKQHIDALKEENRICKEMLDESKHLVEVLQVSLVLFVCKKNSSD